MADWTAPFHAPKFTDDEFEKTHDKYVKKHGYTVTIPSWDDVIHIKRFPPLTEKEKLLWTGKMPAKDRPTRDITVPEIEEWIKTKGTSPPRRIKLTDAELKDLIPADRREEIRAEKQRKKDRYTAMLQSPAPKIARSAGSIMTALDDTQDALSTLACIGMIAGLIVGGTTAALLAGPVGWIAEAATILSLLNPQSWIKSPFKRSKTGRLAKKEVENFTDKNPFGKEARLRVAQKMRKFRPSVANAIEALQVTDTIFGIGISIGPLMGLAQDVIFGMGRQITGEQILWKTKPPNVPKHVKTAHRMLKSSAVTHGYPWESNMSEEVQGMIAVNLATQITAPYLQDWNPIDNTEDLGSAMIDAPRPIDTLTLEIITESGKTLDEVCAWPQNGETAISLTDLQDATAQQATKNLQHFALANKNDVLAMVGGQNAHDFALASMEAFEWPETIVVQYSKIERIVIIIMDNGWVYPDDITDAQREKFEEWCYVHEYMGTMPDASEIYGYAHTFCGFTWLKSPEEQR